MKITLILVSLFLGASADSSPLSGTTIYYSGSNCPSNSDDFVLNNKGYCCVNGEFSGPIVASISGHRSSLQASLSSKFGNSGIHSETADAAQITPAPMKPRADIYRRTITTEATSGLTCIGDSFTTYDPNGDAATGTPVSSSMASPTSGSASTTSMSSSSASGSAGAMSTTSSSTGGMPIVTPGPLLAVGAAAVLAYGAM